jgi:hypothetical protein
MVKEEDKLLTLCGGTRSRVCTVLKKNLSRLPRLCIRGTGGCPLLLLHLSRYGNVRRGMLREYMPAAVTYADAFFKFAHRCWPQSAATSAF